MQALSSEGKTVSIDSANQMKYIANTMKTCTEHIYAKTLKCLDFMKAWNHTLGSFIQNNSMNMIEIPLGLMP